MLEDLMINPDQYAFRRMLLDDNGTDEGGGSGGSTDGDLVNDDTDANKGDDANADANKGKEDIIKEDGIVGDGDDDKDKGDDKGDKGGKPESYDIKGADGKSLPAEQVKPFTDFAGEQNLNQEQAQAVASMVADVVEEVSKQFEKHGKDTRSQEQADWFKAAKSDQHEDFPIGGNNFRQAAADANAFINAFADEAGKEALLKTGIHKHPEFIRMCARAGKEVGEDVLTIAPSSRRSNGTRTGRSQDAVLRSFYPTMFKDK